MPDNQNDLPFVLLVEATQGQGKTHLAYTFPEPIYHIDTEIRGDRVGFKFRARGKEIFWKKVKTFNDIRRVLNELVFPNGGGRGTIVIDSASDFQSWAEAEWLEEAQMKKVWPQTLWTYVYEKMNVLINSMKEQGYNVVFTARRKAEYVDDKTTGALVMEGYKKLPYFADIHLLLENGAAKVLKNGFRDTPTEKTQLIDTPTYDLIRQKLILDTSPQISFDKAPKQTVEKPIEQPEPVQEAQSPEFLAGVNLDEDLDEAAKSAFPEEPEEDESVLLRRACLAIATSIKKDEAYLNRWLASKNLPKFKDLGVEDLQGLHDVLIRCREKQKAEG
jgi:hypothetical protein